MRILCLSDLHNDRGAAIRLAGLAHGARVDLVVSAGDLASDGEHLPSLYSALRAPGVPVLCVPGNHDGRAPYEAAIAAAAWADLHGGLHQEGELVFAGSGVHSDDALPPEPSRQRDDPALTALLDVAAKISPGRLVLVLVTHVPPAGTASARDRREVDRGSVQLRRWIDAHQPAVVVCGHVHHREVVLERLGHTLVVNAGPHGHVLDVL
jgi:Icc-related predicted phosphoesterase